MEWIIDFGRKKTATWVAPGYHETVKNQLGKTVTTASRHKARLVNIQFHLRWKHIAPKEKLYLKQHYGEDAKKQFHEFTRVTLEKLLPRQLLFPEFELETDGQGETPVEEHQ